MAARAELRSVLVIGSGPIVIGQAAEFDYAGTQACRALREEGIRTILINPNPATIMTDLDVADVVYLEPLTLDCAAQVIGKERPQAILPTLGGQTGLNLAAEMASAGVLGEYDVRLLGTPLRAIREAEDRALFAALMRRLGEPICASETCSDVQGALKIADEVGYPVVVRPAYTLGGSGGGIARTPEELQETARIGLARSLNHQVLIEQCVLGWKEIEYEVMRDGAGNCICVCNMENLDPMGVHTGDSIVVAPSQTLSDKEYQRLRSAAVKIIDGLGIEGGCNVQFALHPTRGEYRVIEVNPRVSRSSALASKATGYPIARVAAKIAAGLTLDEIPNAVTGRTQAGFEPALDYVVVKFPRWPFDKFRRANRHLGTQMKSTGEVMAIGRTFEEALAKAIAGLEIGLREDMEWMRGLADEELLYLASEPNDRRFFAICEALSRGVNAERIAESAGYDKWFISKLPATSGRDAGTAYEMVDTCAAEFPATSPYYYSTGMLGIGLDSLESGLGEAGLGETVLVIGSGPIRIGQGIEFDYCSVKCVEELRRLGYRAAIVNNNPETVSTDFDVSDMLFFEPLAPEYVLNAAKKVQPKGVYVQFGGQTAINLAHALHEAGFRLLGTSLDAIDLAEDRERFNDLLDRLEIPRPRGATVTDKESLFGAAEKLGYPVLVRPSYVLGGRGMEIVWSRRQLESLADETLAASGEKPVLVDRYIIGEEYELDLICDGESVLIPQIMEHIERAGVHSGDSMAVCPPQHARPQVLETLCSYARQIAQELPVRGLLNVQFVVVGDRVFVLEVNPRSSRTVPFISKITGIPMVEIATRIGLGGKLADEPYSDGLYRGGHLPFVAVKAPVFSFEKLSQLDLTLGPEMKSTGEVIGIDEDYPRALYKAMLSAGYKIRNADRVFVTLADRDKRAALPLLRKLLFMGFTLFATRGTHEALHRAGIYSHLVRKIHEGSPNPADLIASRNVDLLINTVSQDEAMEQDALRIRRAAAENGIPCFTSLETAKAMVEALSAESRGIRPTAVSLNQRMMALAEQRLPV